MIFSYKRSRHDDRMFNLKRDEDQSVRYAAAVERLTSGTLVTSLGAIYALEQLYDASPSHRTAIASVLAQGVKAPRGAAYNTQIELARQAEGPLIRAAGEALLRLGTRFLSQDRTRGRLKVMCSTEEMSLVRMVSCLYTVVATPKSIKTR